MLLHCLLGHSSCLLHASHAAVIGPCHDTTVTLAQNWLGHHAVLGPDGCQEVSWPSIEFRHRRRQRWLAFLDRHLLFQTLWRKSQPSTASLGAGSSLMMGRTRGMSMTFSQPPMISRSAARHMRALGNGMRVSQHSRQRQMHSRQWQ